MHLSYTGKFIQLLHLGRSPWVAVECVAIWRNFSPGLSNTCSLYSGPPGSNSVLWKYPPTNYHGNEVATVEVKLRPTVSLGVRHPSGTRNQFFFLLEIFFRQLRVCYFVAPSLTRGRILIYCCSWWGPAQSRSGLSLAALKTLFYCPNSWDSLNLEGQVRVFILSMHMHIHAHYTKSWFATVSQGL
jgi:hypothetical protein